MQIVKADGFKKQHAFTYLMKIEYSSFNGDYVTRKDFKENYDRTYFLLDIDQTIVGYYMWYPQEDNSAYLYSIAIDKYYQGNGYSKLLLEHFIFLATDGHDTHCLHVNPNNTKAERLYKNFGFKPVSHVNDFYEDGSLAILMLKEK